MATRHTVPNSRLSDEEIKKSFLGLFGEFNKKRKRAQKEIAIKEWNDKHGTIFEYDDFMGGSNKMLPKYKERLGNMTQASQQSSIRSTRFDLEEKPADTEQTDFERAIKASLTITEKEEKEETDFKRAVAESLANVEKEEADTAQAIAESLAIVEKEEADTAQAIAESLASVATSKNKSNQTPQITPPPSDQRPLSTPSIPTPQTPHPRVTTGKLVLPPTTKAFFDIKFQANIVRILLEVDYDDKSYYVNYEDSDDYDYRGFVANYLNKLRDVRSDIGENGDTYVIDILNDTLQGTPEDKERFKELYDSEMTGGGTWKVKSTSGNPANNTITAKDIKKILDDELWGEHGEGYEGVNKEEGDESWRGEHGEGYEGVNKEEGDEEDAEDIEDIEDIEGGGNFSDSICDHYKKSLLVQLALWAPFWFASIIDIKLQEFAIHEDCVKAVLYSMDDQNHNIGDAVETIKENASPRLIAILDKVFHYLNADQNT